MIYITIVACIGIIILFALKRLFYSPLFMFSVMWGVMLSLFLLHLLGIGSIEPKTEYALCLTYFLFLAGYVSNNVNHKRVVQCDINYLVKLDFDNNFLIILQIIAMLIFLKGATTDVIGIFSGGSMWSYRYTVLPEIRTKFSLTLVMYVANPILYISTSIGILGFFTKTINRNIFINSILLLVLGILYSGGGRIIFIVIISALILSLCIQSPFQYIQKKVKKRITILIVVTVVVVIVITGLRQTVWYESFYLYIVEAIINFDVHRIWFDSDPTYCFGMLSIQGFIRPFQLIMRALGSQVIKNVDYCYYLIDQPVNLRGLGIFNSNVTATMYFYYDGGIIGVAVLSFIWGYISSRLFDNFENTRSLSAGVFLIFANVFVLISFINISTANIEWGMAFIWMLLLKKFRIGKIES